MSWIKDLFDIDIDRNAEIILEELPGIVASVGLIVGGIYLLFDDVKDFGKLDHGGKFLDKLPFPLNIIREHSHHWMWGLTILGIGLVTLVTIIIKILLRLRIIELPKESIRRIKEWLERWAKWPRRSLSIKELCAPLRKEEYISARGKSRLKGQNHSRGTESQSYAFHIV